jgi:hypothetical protein
MRRTKRTRRARRNTTSGAFLCIKKIISGGQTGADQVALAAAKDLGLQTGGWIPKGWRTVEGPQPELGVLYGLKEHRSSEWVPRTAQNTAESDGTVWFGEHTGSRGFQATRREAMKRGKPFHIVPLAGFYPQVDVEEVSKFQQWVHGNGIETLNVAGSREKQSNRPWWPKMKTFLRVALTQTSLGAQSSMPAVEKAAISTKKTKKAKDPLKSLGEELPQFYILPMTISQAYRYVWANIVWLSDQVVVRDIISKSSSYSDAVERVRDAFDLGHRTAQALVGLSVPAIDPVEGVQQRFALRRAQPSSPEKFVESGHRRVDWVKARAEQVPPGTDRGAVAPPSFGIYSQLLGPVATPTGFASSLGIGRQEAPGAPSIYALFNRWQAAQGKASKKPASFFVAPKTYKGRPVAVVITGKRDDYTSVNVGQQEAFGPKNFGAGLGVMKTLVDLYDADSDAPVAVVLPRSFDTGSTDRPKEVTKQVDYQRFLLRLLTNLDPYATLYASLDPSAQGQLKAIIDHPPVFAVMHPSESGEVYFGSLPEVQAWPAIYGETILKLMILGVQSDEEDQKGRLKFLPRVYVSEELMSTPGVGGDPAVTYHAFVTEEGTGKGEPGSPTRKMKEMSRKLASLSRVKIEKKDQVRLSDVTPVREARILFAQNPVPGTPGQFYYLPMKTTLYETEFRPAPGKSGLRQYIGEAIAEDEIYGVDPDVLQVLSDTGPVQLAKMIPMVEVRVCIYEGSRARQSSVSPDRDEAVIRSREVGALLKRETYRIPSRSGEFYVGIPAGVRVDAIDAEGNPLGVGQYQPFIGSKADILPTINRLMRLALAFKTSGPEFAPIPGSQVPWSSPQLPYLFRNFPQYNPSAGEFQLYALDPSDEESVKTYTKLGQRAFLPSALHEKVKGGRAATTERRERSGGTLRGSIRPKSGHVGVGAGWKPKGFYLLVSRLLKVEKERKSPATKKRESAKKERKTLIEGRQEEERFVAEIMEKNWGKILFHANKKREKQGVDLIPSSIKPADLRGKPKLELEIIEALEGILATPGGGVGLISKVRRLMHPSDVLSRETSEQFPEDIVREIEAIKNPRGRGRKPRLARKTRKPRGYSRQAEYRRNPLEEEDWAAIVKWMKDPLNVERGEKARGVEFTEPPSIDKFVSGITALFPPAAVKGSPRRADTALPQLKPEVRLRTLMSQDAVARAIHDDPDATSEASIVAAVASGGDILGAASDYIAKRAGISVLEAEGALKRRMESKRDRSRLISPSGAFCGQYRNTPRLKKWRPPEWTTRHGTCWILVGPPLREGGRARVMSFRNGAYIDCDMITQGLTIGQAVSRSIQMMSVWMAEKEVRQKRISGIYLGQIGSDKARVLWSPEGPLLPKRMVAAAMSGQLVQVDTDPARDLSVYSTAASKSPGGVSTGPGYKPLPKPHAVAPPVEVVSRRKPRKDRKRVVEPPEVAEALEEAQLEEEEPEEVFGVEELGQFML